MSRLEYFLQWLGLWFLTVLIGWSYYVLKGVGETLTIQQSAGLTILGILGVVVAIASFISGIRSLYNALKE